MASQVSREDRLARADFVVDNSGPEAALAAEVDRAWKWIEGLRAA
jgi:dephospho-CoA kinase